ncbi:hypothetical protein FQN50_003809 [Emmonsiellopsis sp. PD_5]|nr:hypothetical protein FQN50_003809 [Emmonsiellopsis sp. PD_5]
MSLAFKAWEVEEELAWEWEKEEEEEKEEWSREHFGCNMASLELREVERMQPLVGVVIPVGGKDDGEVWGGIEEEEEFKGFSD